MSRNATFRELRYPNRKGSVIAKLRASDLDHFIMHNNQIFIAKIVEKLKNFFDILICTIHSKQ